MMLLNGRELADSFMEYGVLYETELDGMFAESEPCDTYDDAEMLAEWLGGSVVERRVYVTAWGHPDEEALVA